jgi:hypothetical protein
VELSSSPKPVPDPLLNNALASLVPLDKGRPIDVWVGSAPATDRQTEIQVAWEALPRSTESGTSVLEIEPLAQGSGVSLGAPQTIPAVTSLARFVLEPGPVSFRMTVRAPDGSEVDRWTDRLIVPDYSDGGVQLGTPRVYRTRSLLESRRFDGGTESMPAVSRHFRRTDRLVIDVPWAASNGLPEVSARLTSRDGASLTTLPLASNDAGRARIVLPLVNLAPSTYVVRVDATMGDERATQQVAFTVSQ